MSAKPRVTRRSQRATGSAMIAEMAYECRRVQRMVFDVCMDSRSTKLLGPVLDDLAKLESSMDRVYDIIHRRLPKLPKSPPTHTPSTEKFRVKLLQLWSFERLCGSEWEGIWETQSVHQMGTDDERWALRRAFITGDGQSLKDQRHNIPTWLILKSGRCLKMTEVYKPNL